MTESDVLWLTLYSSVYVITYSAYDFVTIDARGTVGMDLLLFLQVM